MFERRREVISFKPVKINPRYWYPERYTKKDAAAETDEQTSPMTVLTPPPSTRHSKRRRRSERTSSHEEGDNEESDVEEAEKEASNVDFEAEKEKAATAKVDEAAKTSDCNVGGDFETSKNVAGDGSSNEQDTEEGDRRDPSEKASEEDHNSREKKVEEEEEQEEEQETLRREAPVVDLTLEDSFELFEPMELAKDAQEESVDDPASSSESSQERGEGRSEAPTSDLNAGPQVETNDQRQVRPVLPDLY